MSTRSIAAAVLPPMLVPLFDYLARKRRWLAFQNVSHTELQTKRSSLNHRYGALSVTLIQLELWRSNSIVARAAARCVTLRGRRLGARTPHLQARQRFFD